MSIPGPKRCLVYIVRMNSDLMVAASQIDLRKEFGAPQSVQQLVDSGKGVPVMYGYPI